MMTKEPRDYATPISERPRRWAGQIVASTVRKIEFEARRHLVQNWHSPKCLGLFVQAGSKTYSTALSRFLRLWEPFRRLGNPCVVIDNFSSTPPSLPPGVRFLRGSNAQWEFSGWQEGLEFHLSTGAEVPDWCVCLNSAFVRKLLPNRYSRFLNPVSLALADQGLIGHFADCRNLAIDGFAMDAPFSYRSYDVSRFAITAAFALTGEFAARVGFVAVNEQELDFISPPGLEGTDLFSPTADVSPRFRRYVNDWLQKGWYNAATCVPETRPLLRKKLQAILNERLLSTQIREENLSWSEAGSTRLLTGRSNLADLPRD